jgi:hypothetical protein
LYLWPSSKIHGLPFCVVLRTNVGDNDVLEFSFVDIAPSLLILKFNDDDDNERFVSSIDVSNSCFIDVSLTIGF